MAFKLTCVH